MQVLVSLVEVCSTPFGITGWDGHQGAALPPRLRVLNAFRHHRVGRSFTTGLITRTLTCSTPFGITGWDGPSSASSVAFS